MRKAKLLAFLISATIVALTTVVGMSYIETDRRKKDGNCLVERIEAFRKNNYRLPNAVLELGIDQPMNEGPYYEKLDSANYVVFFSIGFDNDLRYFSKTKQWNYK